MEVPAADAGQPLDPVQDEGLVDVTLSAGSILSAPNPLMPDAPIQGVPVSQLDLGTTPALGKHAKGLFLGAWYP